MVVVSEFALDVKGDFAVGEGGLLLVEEGLLLMLPGVGVSPQAVIRLAEPTALQAGLGAQL